MLLASLRFGFLLTTIVASLHVAAEPRFWTLTGVKFEDGAVATGYFSYDNVTGAVANWNVRVTGGAGSFVPHTYIPGPTDEVGGPAGAGRGYFYFADFYCDRTVFLGPCWRALWFAPLAPLDGSTATVPIDLSPYESYETFQDPDYNELEWRFITAGTLVLTPAIVVQVDEFYHAGLRRYFITASEGEKNDLDTGKHPGWMRTEESFKAYATGSSASGSINPVCRYYRSNSHFYSADPDECLRVFWTFSSGWQLESDNVFQINLPDKMTGACPTGTIPVYRLWNPSGDSNHRYTTSPAIKEEMLAAGYLAEGYGPDGVVMCAVQ
jgi:Repeat of unknown function (DUF5648)